MTRKSFNNVATLYKTLTYKELLEEHLQTLEDKQANIEMSTLCLVGLSKEGPLFSVLEYGNITSLLGALEVTKHMLIDILSSSSYITEEE